MSIAVQLLSAAVVLASAGVAQAQPASLCAEATRHAFQDYPHPYKLAKLTLPSAQGSGVLLMLSVAGEAKPDCGETREGPTCFVRGPAVVSAKAREGNGFFDVPDGQEARISATPQLRCQLETPPSH